MTEGTPQTPEQFRQLNRSLMERVIDRAASDPAWKQRLLDEPEATIREAGFPEAEELKEAYKGARAGALEAEVAGHQGHTGSCEDVCFLMTGVPIYTNN